MTDRHAHVVGLGLIGSSVVLALREAGWQVTGADISTDVVGEALEVQLISSDVMHEDCSLVVIATPVGVVTDVAWSILRSSSNPSLIVTDVAGVKRDIVRSVTDPRFLGGHPMAGSELRGIRGAKADLFNGCTWILTPTETTTATVYSTLHSIWRELGAAVVAVSADDHDRLVALASHIPHIVAGSLMNEASLAAQEDAVLLQLAAGGFRDMTRIAAGDPTIWPDILFQNRDAITAALLSLEERLATIRQALATGERSTIEAGLLSASIARRQLPGRALRSDDLTYLRIPMPDRPGVLAAITMVASEMLVNIYDIEIAHGIEGTAGTLLLAVDREQVDAFEKALVEESFIVVREP